jgi:FkbM family methyltransferase
MSFKNFKRFIRRITPLKIVTFLYKNKTMFEVEKFGLRIKDDGVQYHIIRQKNEIRISTKHEIYLNDIVENFEFYFSGVKPFTLGDINVVDFSTPRWHWVTGFDPFPILFPSFAEPIVTTKQYIEFADFKTDAVVIDLGAYSGLTSILFDMAIPSGEGRVIAIEADSHNLIACQENFSLYQNLKNRKIELIHAAIWKDNEGVSFSSEGNMGSSTVSIVGSMRGENITVPSYTLDSLAEKFCLSRVDFIKCDIEGGETEIFDIPEFFDKFSPKILIECHIINGSSTVRKCQEVLSKFGYACEEVQQEGFPLPLLMCKRLLKVNELNSDNR